MPKEKITEGFTQYTITVEQLIEFAKIAGELREIFAKNRAAIKRKQNEKKKWYKNANAIRYGELK